MQAGSLTGRHLLLVGAVAGALGAALLGAQDPAAGEPALIMLLRFMAVLKALCAAGAVALAAWRLRQPAPASLAAAYSGATALMATSPVLIWNMSHVIAGAVLFHGGLLLFLGLAWADGRSWKSVSASRRRPASRTAATVPSA